MTAIVNSKGEIQVILTGPEDFITANTPDGCIAVEDPPAQNMYYEDGWVAMPAQPSSYHVFNYDLKNWIDPRTLDEIKAQKWAEIRLQRDNLEFGGFEFQGGVYDSDQVSQGRIMGAAMSQTDQVWTLADNTTVELSSLQLQQLYAALQAHIASIHERGRIARQLISEAETKEQVEAIQL